MALRRFLLHLLRGFVRIRHFGFLANRRRAKLLSLCMTLLATAPPATAPTVTPGSPDPEFSACAMCGGPMVILVGPAPAHTRPPPIVAQAL